MPPVCVCFEGTFRDWQPENTDHNIMLNLILGAPGVAATEGGEGGTGAGGSGTPTRPGAWPRVAGMDALFHGACCVCALVDIARDSVCARAWARQNNTHTQLLCGLCQHPPAC